MMIRLVAMFVFAASIAANFRKKGDATLISCLFNIIGWLMLIYCKL